MRWRVKVLEGYGRERLLAVETVVSPQATEPVGLISPYISVAC
jgi:hypothetical protein